MISASTYVQTNAIPPLETDASPSIGTTAGSMVKIGNPTIPTYIHGDLIVEETTTTVNSATLEVSDLTIHTGHNNCNDIKDSAFFMEYSSALSTPEYAGLQGVPRIKNSTSLRIAWLSLWN